MIVPNPKTKGGVKSIIFMDPRTTMMTKASIKFLINLSSERWDIKIRNKSIINQET